MERGRHTLWFCLIPKLCLKEAHTLVVEIHVISLARSTFDETVTL